MKYIELRQDSNFVEYEKPELIRQETLDTSPESTVENLVFRVYAANRTRARVIARGYIRKNYPTIKNILSPEVLSSEKAKQSTIRNFFPDTFQLNEYEVGVVIVK